MDLSTRLIEEEEGDSSALMYYDSRGMATIARGCLVDRKAPGAEGLCELARAAQDAYSLNKAKALAAALPGFNACSDVRQAVLVSMSYQLGDLHSWTDFRAALAARDYEQCSQQMLYDDPGTANQRPTDWFKETPVRCRRQAWMLRNNTWLDHGAPIPQS